MPCGCRVDAVPFDDGTHQDTNAPVAAERRFAISRRTAPLAALPYTLQTRSTTGEYARSMIVDHAIHDHAIPLRRHYGVMHRGCGLVVASNVAGFAPSVVRTSTVTNTTFGGETVRTTPISSVPQAVTETRASKASGKDSRTRSKRLGTTHRAFTETSLQAARQARNEGLPWLRQGAKSPNPAIRQEWMSRLG